MVERQDHAIVGTFLVPSLDGGVGEQSLPAEVAHHLRVRRVAVDARLRLTDGAGRSAHATLLELSKGQARVALDEVRELPQPEPLHLLAPVADRDRMLWLAEKAVELGITRWTPVRWRRSHSVASRGAGVGFHGKVRARMTAALEQSGGSWLPAVDEEAEPDSAVDALASGVAGERLVLDAGGDPMLGIVPPRGAVVLAVGPEGGLEPTEIAQLRDAGFQLASIGATTLRFETAGVAALALVVAARAAAAPPSGHGR